MTETIDLARHGLANSLAGLPALSTDDVEDAEFRGKDLAWAEALSVYEDRREAEGLTFEALGARIGKKRSQVHRWLADPFKISLRALGLLAEGMDCDLMISVKPRHPKSSGTNHFHPCEPIKIKLDWGRAERTASRSPAAFSVKVLHND